MNPNMDWNRVNARPVITMPEQIRDGMLKSFADTNNEIERNWRNIWIPNIKANTKFIGDFSRYGYYNICGTKEGRTAYLVGGGPSLRHNITDLKKTKDADIWTSAHTLKYLVKNGIRPDYTVVLDGKDRQAEWLDIGDESKGMNLLMDIHCTPKIFNVWKGPMIFFRSTAMAEDAFTREQYAITDFDHVALSGGNVITSAYYMIMRMGYKRVVFVGNDLANDVNDVRIHYADGSVDDGMIDRMESEKEGKSYQDPFRDSSIECDIQGLGVWSRGRMFNYKYWLDLRSQENTGIEHINATEAGILGAYPEGNIKSIKQMRLCDVEFESG